MNSVTVILTCYNRIKKTRRALETISDGDLDMRYIIVDDASTDGTGEYLEKLQRENRDRYVILRGDGKLYWAGGMRKGIGWYLSHSNGTDYVVLINDDVEFYPGILRGMIEKSRKKDGAVIVGSTTNSDGMKTYGGVIYEKGSIRGRLLDYTESDRRCDTFNCNCLLMSDETIRKTGNFDEHYSHSFADFDYGFMLKKMKIPVYETDQPVGMCFHNKIEGTWRDTSLTKKQRIKAKESPKGLPRSEWFYFLKKNFGLRKALWHSITPYIRILINR